MLCSSVTRLPLEVLNHIFLFYVALLDERTSVTLPAQGPFCLAQVCSHWRAIALSGPRLWSFIYLVIPGSFGNHTKGMERFTLVFDLYLKRSGTLPISLTCCDARCDLGKRDKLSLLLVDLLRTYSHRWKRLSFVYSRAEFPRLTFSSCNLSSLEYLSIIGPYFPNKLCLDLESAKNLKSFAYSGPEDLLSKIRLHWDRLEEVSFQFAPGYEYGLFEEHYRCLAWCQSITTCSLHARMEATWRRTTLPRLRTLRVRLCTYESRSNNIIDALILPQLQTLEISPDSFESPKTSPVEGWQFPRLLGRSGCSLQHLSIQDISLPNADILRCLRHSSSLLSFHYVPESLSSNDLGDLVCKLRVWPLDQVPKTIVGPLVPELREITLGVSVPANLDTIMAVCRSRGGSHARAAGVAALRRVGVVLLYSTAQRPVQFAPCVISPLVSLACLQTELAEWVAELENEGKNGGEVLGERLETSVEAFHIRDGQRVYNTSHRRSSVI